MSGWQYVAGHKITDPEVIARMRRAIDKGHAHTLSLTVWDFLYDSRSGELTIDGQDPDEWLDALTEGDAVPHVDYPHEPDTLYDCPACDMPA